MQILNDKVPTFSLKNQVLRFDVSMDDAIQVQVLQSHEYTRYEELLVRQHLLVCYSLNLLFLIKWYRKSPPFTRSITKNRFSLFWNA